jgi:hypothetical protein
MRNWNTPKWIQLWRTFRKYHIPEVAQLVSQKFNNDVSLLKTEFTHPDSLFSVAGLKSGRFYNTPVGTALEWVIPGAATTNTHIAEHQIRRNCSPQWTSDGIVCCSVSGVASVLDQLNRKFLFENSRRPISVHFGHVNHCLPPSLFIFNPVECDTSLPWPSHKPTPEMSHPLITGTGAVSFE